MSEVLVRTHVCECNGRDYYSAQGLRAHQRSQKHITWQNRAELRELKAELTRRDNRIAELSRDLAVLRDFNQHLVRELHRERSEALPSSTPSLAAETRT